MNERKDRTILVVSIVVVVGVLLSVIGSCLGGGLAGYVLARREVRQVEERLDQLEARGVLNLPELLPGLEEILPRLPELLERLRQLEGLNIPDSLDRFRDFELPELPEGFPDILPPDLPEMPGFGEESLNGAWIREIVPDSPAEAAGLQPDDLIIAVDGVTVDENHLLEALIGQKRPGDRVEITYVREGEEDTLSVRLGEHPDDPERPYLGVYFVAVSMQQRFERNIDPDQPQG